MKKKLIEVALPLEAINAASVREKSIRHGHPSTLHLWWARRPLAACRAVLFASLVDDPSEHLEEFPTEAAQDAERQRLFGIIEELVQWENSNNLQVLDAARAEILKATGGNPPPVLDPFCGGGSIPLEAQRLGLEAHASDLNPVAVLITKALIEIPPKFAGQPPINPEVRRRHADSGTWTGAAGLAEDVRYYGQWMRDEAWKRIGHLYPKARLPKEQGGGEATVIAWIWARTVKCPNPACGVQMPLVRSFALSTKAGKQAWVEPATEPGADRVRFTVKSGAGKPREGTVGRRGAVCVACNTPVPLDYVRAEGRAKRMGSQLMAIVAEGRGGRVYLPPTPEHEAIAAQAKPEWTPDTNLPEQALGFRVQGYGMTTHADLFTPRQLVALTTFSDLVSEARERVRDDAQAAGLSAEQAQGYADAVATYLAFAVDKGANYWSSLCAWYSSKEIMVSTLARNALPIVWDYTEANPFSDSSGNFMLGVSQAAEMLENLSSAQSAYIRSQDAMELADTPNTPALICTDPPYYDNVPYADLSDFFYVWLRKSVGPIYREICSTVLVPKHNELIADPTRQGGREAARSFFESGLCTAFRQMRAVADFRYPMTVYYAFKQAESDGSESDAVDSVASTGWETMLEALIASGLSVTGTWPVRTEQIGGLRLVGRNSLASSIVLVCRPRPENAPVATRREFITALRRELEDALLHMMHGNVAPVDLAQATIGPGMAVHSRYSKVIETDGSPLRVRTALQIINQELDTILSAQEGDYDTDTRFCVAWFEQFGMNSAAFGEADVMARAKNTSVQGLHDAGVLEARAGRVRLLKREEYPADWNPQKDARKPVWECAQQLVRALQEQGESGAARLCAQLGSAAEPARDLAYRLYSICERKGWAQEALAYNSLVMAWPEITRLASSPAIHEPQTGLFA